VIGLVPLRRIGTWLHLAPDPNDPQHVALRRALRVTVVASGLFVLLDGVLDEPDVALTAVFAVLTLGSMADFAGPLPRRALRYALSGLASLAMLPLGALVSDSDVAVVALTGVVVFITLYLATLGGPFFAARFPVVLALLLAATTPADGSVVGERVLGWALGTAAISIAAVVLWPVPPGSSVSTLVAQACRALASGSDSDPLLALARRLRTTAVGSQLHPGAVAADERVTAELVHAMERLIAIRVTRDHVEPAPEDAALQHVTLTTLEQCADALEANEISAAPGARLAEPLEHAIQSHVAAGHRRVTERDPEAPDLAARTLPAREEGRATCTVAHLVDELVGPVNDDESIVLLDDSAIAALRAQWTPRSLWFRNAVRASVALMVAVGIVLAGAGEGHGFWVALGAFSVVRADLATTGRSAREVVIGTAIGFLVSSLVVVFAGDHGTWVLWAVFPVAMCLSAFGSRIRPEIGAAAFTTMMVALYSLLTPAGLKIGEVRLVDVTIGAALTLAVGAILWPRVGTVPRGLLADVVTRAQQELTRSAALAARAADAPPGDGRGPLALLTDLDRVLDTISSDAPRALTDQQRSTVVATVSTSVHLALLLEGESALPWVGLGPEDRMPHLPADPTVDDALLADVREVADDLTRMARRLAGDRLRDGQVATEPRALLDVVEQRLAAPPDTTDPEIDFVALRMGVGLGRLVRLTNG